MLVSGILTKTEKRKERKDWSEEVAQNAAQTSKEMENMRDWNLKARTIRPNRCLVGVSKEENRIEESQY